MFGKRSNDGAPKRVAPVTAASASAVPMKPADVLRPAVSTAEPRPSKRAEPVAPERRHSEEYYDVKTTVFNALIDTIDLTQLAKLEAPAAREEIRDIVSEIIQLKNVVMSIDDPQATWKLAGIQQLS